jgi:hypothetical protein
MAGGNTANHICTWNGTTYNTFGSGFTSPMMGGAMVHSMCVYNGNLYAGGMFEHAGTMDMHNLAMWNGSAWSSCGDIEGAMMGDNEVSTMCVYNGQLCIGGNFGSCGTSSTNNLGMWNGSTWSSIGTGMNGKVNALAIYHNDLYIAGSFTNAAGTAVSNIAKYNSTTGIQTVTPQSLSLDIYPNPATDFIQLSWSNEMSATTNITIADITGRNIMQLDLGTTSSGLHKQIFPVNNWSEGIYFLTLNSGDKKLVTKFQVAK